MVLFLGESVPGIHVGERVGCPPYIPNEHGLQVTNWYRVHLGAHKLNQTLATLEKRFYKLPFQGCWNQLDIEL